jgi:hypothetical protein
VMRCVGSSFFMRRAKYSPDGPPPMQTMRMRLIVRLAEILYK